MYGGARAEKQRIRQEAKIISEGLTPEYRREASRETTRQVLVFTDRTNGVSQYFSDGTLISTRPARRVFEGNKLVCQIMLNEDGSTASEIYMERDDEGKILSYDIPYGENLRRVTTYTYERIG